MDQHTKNNIIAASQKDDVEEVKQWLRTLNILKEPGLIKNTYGAFLYLGKRVSDNLLDNWDTPTLMTSLFINAAANSNINFCKYLVESKELRMHVAINRLELWADLVSLEHLDVIKYLIDSPRLKNRGRLIVNSLKYVRDKPKLEILKYLIDDPSMPHHKEMAEALNYFYPPDSEESFEIFTNACASGNKEWAKFFLEKEMVNKSSFIKAIRGACIYKHCDLFEYLLHPSTSPYKPYDDYNPQYFFKTALKQNTWDIVQVLIFDLGMEKPDDLDAWLYQDIDKKALERVQSMFEKRELKESLGEGLDVNPQNKKVRAKI